MKLICSLFLFIVLFNHTKTKSLSAEQIKQSKVCINAYLSAVKLYSVGGVQKDQQKRELKSLSENPLQTKHVNDLNLFATDDQFEAEDNTDYFVANYVRDIDDKFHFNIAIEFGEPILISCIEKDLAIYTVKKSITVNNKTRIFNQVILVTLPKVEEDGSGYKVSAVLSNEYYKSGNNTCSSSIVVNSDEFELYQKSKDADRNFFERNFLKAKNLYEYILNKSSDDPYIKKQVALCTQSLTRVDYLNKANEFFTRKDYESASYWYKKLLTEYPKDIDRDNVENLISLAKQNATDENYRKEMDKGNAAFLANNYGNARYSYEQALRIKPGDNFATSKLEKAKIEDDKYAEDEIDRVIGLVNQNPKYSGEYFRVLMKYEGYSTHYRLKTKQCYNMVLLLNSYDKNVMNAMKFSRKEARLYCKIYCKKLNDLYYRERDLELREKVRHLLDNVINSNNQN